MGLPEVSVTYEAPEKNSVEKAERGILAIVVQDDTKDFTCKTYGVTSDMDAGDYTAENLKAVKAAFAAGPHKVIVVRIGTDDAFTEAENVLDKLVYDWLCSPSADLQTALVAYVKKVNTDTRARSVKCIATVANADNEHVHWFPYENVTLTGEDSTTAAALYMPRMGGILAACPLDQSVTSYALDDIDAVSVLADINNTIDKGGLCIYQDDQTFRIARGVNSLQTMTGKTEDMKKITVIEGMDFTRQCIITLFKEQYMGKKKNTADSQAVLLADILGIFGELVAEGVLDGTENATVSIDVAAMRKAWTDAGTDVSGLSDTQVKNKTYGSKVFLMASGLRFLDAMEDLNMAIRLG